MKVLLCERTFTGHRKTYIQWLSQIPGIDFYLYTPENVGVPTDRFFLFEQHCPLKSWKSYILWLRQIRKIVKENGIDVVHIADGDSQMRYFGWGLHSMGCSRVIITYHHFFGGTVRKLSYRLMNAGRSVCCVVHTDNLLSQMKKIGISDAIHCDYPSFHFHSFEETDSSQCKKKLGLPEGIPVMGIIGGLNSYKHILPFLRVLHSCKQDFRLLICGKPSDITADEIKKAAAPYLQKVCLIPRMLSEEEYRTAVAASDLIYSLYGTEFQGASGPLTDGVCCRKMILSCAHGSLGEITEQHHLGLTADVTDRDDILQKTEASLARAIGFKYDEMAEAYRNRLMPETFLETYKQIYMM